MTDTPVPSLPAQAPWNLLQRVAVRFAVVYFGLLFVGQIFDGLLAPFANLAAEGIWHLPTPLPSETTGSGDRLIDWMQALACLILATLTAVVWSVWDRRKAPVLAYEVLRVMLRYFLGMTLITYGFAKTSQFPSPSLYEYAEPLGKTTPMGLMWTFMGYSLPYSLFAGALEVSGAFLLFFRRTTTLGAVLYAIVMLNVFVLNLCYDVPVKLTSFHLLVGALILLLPDAGRLWDVFVMNRPTQPRILTPPIRYRKLRVAVLSIKWALISLMIYIFGALSYGYWEEAGTLRKAEEGVWSIKDGSPSKWEWAIVTDTQMGLMVRVHLRAGGIEQAVLVDSANEASSLPRQMARWTYRLEDKNRLILRRGSNTVELLRDDTRFPLMRHGFHWIQERPRTP